MTRRHLAIVLLLGALVMGIQVGRIVAGDQALVRLSETAVRADGMVEAP